MMFMVWALGPDWRQVRGSQIAYRWNELHGDLFLVHRRDPWQRVLTAMQAAWGGAMLRDLEEAVHCLDEGRPL